MINFTETFKSIAQSKQITSVTIVQYAILRAMRAKTPVTIEDRVKVASSFVRRHFRSIKNKRMLDNGVDPDRAVRRATEIVKSAQSVFGVPQKEFFGYDAIPEKAQRDTVMYKNIAVALYDQFKIPADYYKRSYVYIFVRQDMSPEYQLVQAAHAAAKMGHRLGNGGIEAGQFDELYFSVIGVPGLTSLANALADFRERGLVTYPFIEPDIGNVMTAFASEPIPAAERKGLLAYKRLVFERKA